MTPDKDRQSPATSFPQAVYGGASQRRALAAGMLPFGPSFWRGAVGKAQEAESAWEAPRRLLAVTEGPVWLRVLRGRLP